MEPKKNPKSDLEKNKRMFFEVGLVVALALVLTGLNWKSYDESEFELGELNLDEIEEEIIPVTEQQKPPPPPPPPPKAPEVIEVVEDDEEIEEEIEIDTEADQDTEIEIMEQPEENIQEEQIFTVVENMPTMPGCEDKKSKMEKDQCTTQKIFQHLASVQKYPQMAKEAGIQGTVFVSFVIGKDGDVSEVEVLRGVSGGKALDKEAVRMIKSLPSFNPGQQRGKPVKVRYNLPVRFTLK